MNRLALAHPYHERKSCSKFGSILPSGLGGNSVVDRWTDPGRKNNIALVHPYHDGNSPNSNKRGDSMTDRWVDARQMDVKIVLLSHILTMRGSQAAIVKFRPVV